MLELNKWFFVLLLNFLVLLFILNIILFKPILMLFKNREGTIRDSLNAAKEMERKKEEAILRMNRELLDARNRAKAMFENMRNEGMNRQKELLEGAGKQSHGLTEKARAEIKAEAESARQRLRSDVDRFSDEIVRKLIGK